MGSRDISSEEKHFLYKKNLDSRDIFSEETWLRETFSVKKRGFKRHFALRNMDLRDIFSIKNIDSRDIFSEETWIQETFFSEKTWIHKIFFSKKTWI